MRWSAVLALVVATATAHADDTKPPVLLQAAAPIYPPDALAAGLAADVRVRLHVDTTGVVTAVDIVEKRGHGFDEAATAAALQYVFEPAQRDGAPVAIVVETTIHFVIEQQPAEPVPQLRPHVEQPPNHAGAVTAPVNVQGVAVERGTRRKLAGVIVSIAELGLDALTGDDGAFYFHGVPPGGYRVIAVDPRFDRLERPIAIEASEALELRLWLKPRGGNPYETVVEGERETLEVTKRTLQRQQLANIPGTFGDPVRVIQTLPGVGRTPFGLGLLLVRGSDGDDSAVFLDGHEIPTLYHFLGGPSVFNVEMLESLELYPGGFPARFGRHHGGIVALETRPTQSDGVHGSAKVGVLDAGGYLRAPLAKDVSIAVAGRRSYIDTFLDAVLPAPGNGARRIVTPVYYDYQARLDVNLHGEGRLAAFLIGSSDTLHVVQQDPNVHTSEALDAAIRFYRVIASYTRPLGGDLSLVLSPAWGRDTTTASGGSTEATSPFATISVETADVSMRARVHGRVSPRFTLDTGLDVRSHATIYSALVPLDDNLTGSEGVEVPPSQLFHGAHELGVGAYIDLGIDVSPKLRVIPSVRADTYLLDGQSRSSIDPRIAARYQVSPEWTLKGYVGKFTQPPPPESFDLRFGNPAIDQEVGVHYGLGYEWRPDSLWTLDSEVYLADRRDLVIATDDLVMNADGTFRRVNEANTGRKYSYGFEAIVKRAISERAYGWLSYTYSKSRVRRTPTSDLIATRFDEPHLLNAVISYKPGAGFELGARFQLATGRPDTPIVGATYDADTGDYTPVMGPERSTRVPTFSQLDVRAERDWLFDTWSLGVYLDVINVLDTSNVEATQYDYRYRQSSPITSFPLLPTIGVTGSW